MRQADLLDKIVRNFRDDDNQTIIGMAIIASAGREAREVMVRTLVNRFGVLWPPAKDENGKTILSESTRAGRMPKRDRDINHQHSIATAHSWSPLHFAALLASPPLVSFLLTRGCNPAWTTSKGLTALDIVEGMPGRDDVTALLQGVGEAAAMVTPNPSKFSPALSSAGPSNLHDEMVGEMAAAATSTPRTDFSPNLSITTEEANEEVERQDSDLRDRRTQALERHRRLKRAAIERRLRKERRKAEDQQADLAVRMRLLNMGMAEDDAAYLMRDYESHWVGNAAQIRIRRMVDEEDSDDERDDESASGSDTDSVVEVDDGLAELVDGFEDKSSNHHNHPMDEDVELNSDDEREDDTLQSSRVVSSYRSSIAPSEVADRLVFDSH